MSFAKSHGKMSVIPCKQKDDEGKVIKEFNTCGFTNPEDDSVTFVAFSSKLGELTPAEIASRKDDLQVVELQESGNYILCEKGSGAWLDVDLGI